MPLMGALLSLPQKFSKGRLHRDPQPTWVVTIPQSEGFFLTLRDSYSFSAWRASESLFFEFTKILFALDFA